MDKNQSISVREKLILAGIEELENHGMQSFSMRRTAAACGMSCAAPYKHFEDKEEFVYAIIDYIYERWDEVRRSLVAGCDASIKSQLICISIGYIRFLHENPHFRSIIMMRDVIVEKQGKQMLLRLTEGSRQLIEQYCESVGMPPEVKARKLFLVRSLIYGAALMLDSGELDIESLDMVEALIGREFEIA